ncbi:hypothetical protein DM867_09800 [Halosegnis rubeus]|jgi:hypothetical protein|uniref:Uncharacterized protein n=1 Tax=Halosegnis rubeus TaxID=2212850 RepID=A0A5N5UID0_9EURY|nr:hypothetical protein [Halosegnis rubeus]KAB7513269.1 hypothetical protein DM867_09800 [Halosegnis rubeus]KAB7517252.1 hypothetical protein DP108_09545 [Halosegnis rubeus]KAB7518516.1 hypothetical protein DMP03_03940 [Halosegnis rubeus]
MTEASDEESLEAIVGRRGPAGAAIGGAMGAALAASTDATAVIAGLAAGAGVLLAIGVSVVLAKVR